jgi:uncharacterized protein (DUF362 family)
MTGLRIVGNLVLGEAGAFQGFHRHFKEIRIERRIGQIFRAAHSQEIFGILLVSETVRRNMLGPDSESLLQGCPPLFATLSGNAENEVQVDIIKAGLAKNLIAPFRLTSGVDTPECGKQPVIPALHSHAHAIDAEFAKHCRLLAGYRRWVHFHREFFEIGDIDSLPKTANQIPQLRGRKCGRGPSAEEYRPGLHARGAARRFDQDHVKKTAGLVPVTRFLVKAAIWAHLRTEGNVDVEVRYHSAGISRRIDKIQKMKAVLGFTLLLALGVPAAAHGVTRVYYAMDTNAIGPARSIQSRVVRRMVDSLVCGVTGTHSAAEAWRSLVSPDDKVGIKVAAAGRSISGTNPEVVDAIVDGLAEAGVPAKSIIVWDRSIEDLQAAGFKKDGAGYVLEGIDPKTGYDQQSQVSAPVLGKLIWGDSRFGDRSGHRLADLLSGGDQLSSQSFFAKVVTTKVTKVINVPSLTDSYLTGINGGIVNMTLPNIDNWRRFAKAAAEGASYIAEVYAHPLIHEKVVLTVLDALILQYAGGPFPDPNFSLDNYALFASKDPVAIDAIALRLIEDARKASKMPRVKPMTTYLEAASELGLGECAESRIQTIRVGIEGIR